jgi:hypothetical protein
MNGQAVAKVYNQNEGHPDRILPDLNKFFSAVSKQNRDIPPQDRYNAAVLASKYIVWAADYASRLEKALKKNSRVGKFRFSGLEMVIEDPKQANYVYQIHCDRFVAKKSKVFPEVHLVLPEGAVLPANRSDLQAVLSSLTLP